ncbi:MAG: SIMPL domain-containing protein [Actinomycetota bacterium]|nr:SIMPL domain-containing protein [Actinomycetota bacterium]
MRPRIIMAATALVTVLAAACDGQGGSTGVAGAPAEVAAAQLGPNAAVIAEGVTVTGVGRITGRPDTLRATVGVEVERETVQEALDAANAAVDQVLSALGDHGVEEPDIQTTEFSVQPRVDHPRDGPPTVRGYAVTNLVDVKLRDLDRAGEVLQAAVEAAGDAARVHGMRFTLEDNDELLAAARDAAFGDARAKAEQYAQLAERDLGRLVGVSEQLGGDQPPPKHLLDRAQDAGAVPIRPGEQEVAVHVTAVWALE